MNDKLKSVLEGLAWTVGGAFLMSLGSSLGHGDFEKADLMGALAAAATAAAAYMRGLSLSDPWRTRDTRASDIRTPK